MPQQDSLHNVVKHALEKDGWMVTHEPLTIRLEDVKFYVDLAAEKEMVENNHTEKVAIEIKVFGGLSFLNEFEKAVGQYAINLLRNKRRKVNDALCPPRVVLQSHSRSLKDSFIGSQIH